MAKNTQPIAKRCKALGISPAVMGYSKKTTTRNSEGNFRKKQSEYATQLKEKQKVKFIYGVLELSLIHIFSSAAADAVDVGQTDLDPLLTRQINARNTCHCSTPP